MQYRMTYAAIAALSVTIGASAGMVIADAEKTPDFAAVDTDRDGYISSTEADSVPELRQVFVAADVDRDGQLNTSEWTEAVARLRAHG